MKAFIDPITCSTVVGMLRAKRYKRPFQALLQQLVVPPTLPPSAPPAEAVCGDGVRTDFEVCDDGNTSDCDGCAGDCSRRDAQCGDGIIECGEQCDGHGCGAGERCEDCRCVPDSTAAACAEASTCENKQYCGSLNCRCIRSAEGAIGCGSVPSCDVPKCGTSADCAPLGDGYFCDTPHSGCCADGELARCISPCGAVPDPDNVLPAQSADIQRLLVEVAKAKRGASADLDGDGTPDVLVTTLPDGSTVTTSPPDAAGHAGFASRIDPAGEETTLIDLDLDGIAEQEVRFAPGPPPVRVTETDTNHDGIKDRRETATYDVNAGTVRLLREDDPEGDGTFAVVSDTTEPIGRDAGAAKCDGTQGFPVAPSFGSRLRFGAAGDISVPYNDDGSGGRCTKPRAQRIMKAVSCALDKGFKCLERSNDALSKQLFSTMVHETLHFGCGNPCAGTDATTIPWLRVPGFRDGKINFNSSQLDGMTDQELCGVTLHEMLHWAGEGLQGAADHDQGTDRTYSCGRYCGGCIKRGPDPAAVGKPSGPNADCARCAGTEAEKARCGLKKKEQDILCPEYNLCHAGLAGNIQCEECRGTKQLFCDDTETSILPEFRCCKKCPSGYFSNDKPCFGDGTTLASCGSKPPDCP
jgi:cysteine-rich repeat protein